MKTFFGICWLGLIIVSATPHSMSVDKTNLQDTTEIALLKKRLISAEQETAMQKKIAEKNAEKVNELTILLKECNSKKKKGL